MTDYSASECGPNRYPAPLWEWSDTTDDSHLVGFALPLRAGDGRGPQRSLRSRHRLVDREHRPHPRVPLRRYALRGRAPVDPDDGTDVIDMFVAIIGGGLDHEAPDKTLPSRGNWLYMLDIETGKVDLQARAVQPLSTRLSCINPGSVASEPAAVDTNLDGYIDRIYVATTGGFVFRADLEPSASSGKLPALTAQTVAAIDPDTGAPFDLTAIRVQRDDLDGRRAAVGAGARSSTPTGTSIRPSGTATATAARRPLYQRPTVFFAALLDRFGLAFGSGNREDLWQKMDQEAALLSLHRRHRRRRSRRAAAHRRESRARSASTTTTWGRTSC